MTLLLLLNQPGAASSLSPGSGGLAYTGYAPAMGNVSAIAPGAGSLVYTGYAPSRTGDSSVRPGADTLAYTGYAPIFGLAQYPATARLRYTGYIPTVTGLTADFLQIPPVQNMDLLRQRANTILETLQRAMPGYGEVLPYIPTTPDGRLFVLTTTQTLYQLQNGAWVAVDMVP